MEHYKAASELHFGHITGYSEVARYGVYTALLLRSQNFWDETLC
jgi:hypothetical protein